MKEFITAKEAAALTDLATNTITLAAQNGELKGYKQGGKWLLLLSSVLELKKNPHKKGCKRSPKRVPNATATPEGQLTIYDLEAPSYVPKHAKEPYDWKELARFTYEDLLNQYNRGIEEGKRLAREELQKC